MNRWAAWALCCACSSDPALLPVPELVPAIDMNPDPNIVEVTIATAATVEYKPVARRRCSRIGTCARCRATVPGPMIVTNKAIAIVHFKNDLVASSVHWHGLRLPNAMDGVAAVAANDPRR
jgi:FtsP/CotA-like multicopper oxidase with cupredoxin domain